MTSRELTNLSLSTERLQNKTTCFRNHPVPLLALVTISTCTGPETWAFANLSSRPLHLRCRQGTARSHLMPDGTPQVSLHSMVETCKVVRRTGKQVFHLNASFADRRQCRSHHRHGDAGNLTEGVEICVHSHTVCEAIPIPHAST